MVALDGEQEVVDYCPDLCSASNSFSFIALYITIRKCEVSAIIFALDHQVPGFACEETYSGNKWLTFQTNNQKNFITRESRSVSLPYSLNFVNIVDFDMQKMRCKKCQ